MASWALPVAIVGGVLLIREIKGSGAEAEAAARRLVAEGADAAAAAAATSQQALYDLLAGAAASGEAAGIAARDAAREAAARAAVAEAIPVVERQQAEAAAAGGAGYGSVGGSEGVYTGQWRNVAPTAANPSGDRCSVELPTVHGYAHRFYTGAYCRTARAQGLIN
jgi:hypothetical protein